MAERPTKREPSGTTTSITVQLTNPNPVGSSEISYQIVPVPGGSGASTAYMTYNNPFTISQAAYPNGFGILDNDEVSAMAVLGTYLYAATLNVGLAATAIVALVLWRMG